MQIVASDSGQWTLDWSLGLALPLPAFLKVCAPMV